MVRMIINENICDLCLECVESCSTGALTEEHASFKFNSQECAYCEVCIDVCEKTAIIILEDDLNE